MGKTDIPSRLQLAARVVRAAVGGAARFDELVDRCGASPDQVASMLRELCDARLVAPAVTQYRLTARGRALAPSLLAVAGWSDRLFGQEASRDAWDASLSDRIDRTPPREARILLTDA